MFVVPVAVGGFQDQQITGIWQVRVRQNRGICAAQVPGKSDPEGGSARMRKRKLDKAGTQNMAGIFQMKGNAVFELKGVIHLESPGQIVDSGFHGPDLTVGAAGKGHAVPEHGDQQSLGGISADDLAFEPGIDKIRNPADMINVGMGKKQVIDIRSRHRPLPERQHRIMALGNAAVHQKGDTVGLHQMARAGNTVFSSDVV